VHVVVLDQAFTEEEMSAAAKGVESTGRSSPLGATVVPSGVNFSVFSWNASGVELLFFDREDDAQPARVITIDPVANRTYHYWHVFVPGVRPGQLYAYRVQGPSDPANGLRFDPAKVLLDPYGRGVVVPKNYSRNAARLEGDNAATAMKSVVVDPHAYDWEGDSLLHRPSSQTIIYEMHVKGFTRHPSSGVSEKTRGTYAGLIEKIPYLQQLGITAVELLPVFQFDVQDAPPGQVNYWGYAPISFFAPHQGYSSRRDPLGPVNEFRDMVKALHRAGIEVILDVVFNHTAEGDHLNDLVSYNQKHNEPNGEDNRDGANDNRSWNWGVEGPTDDPAIEKLRNRQVKNFLTVTMLSLGLPMILMGDEVRRTQQGNNNAYCQDNETSWFDWTLVAKHADVHRFVTLLSARRLLQDLEPERQRLSLNQVLRKANKAWHGVKLGQPDWGASSHSLAFSAEARNEKLLVYLILNAYWEPLDFELPLAGNGNDSWRRWIDTSLDSPHDIVDWQTAPPIPGRSYRAGARSVVVLFAGVEDGANPSL
jgi:pullulanase/glycogen debranching enzyme